MTKRGIALLKNQLWVSKNMVCPWDNQQRGVQRKEARFIIVGGARVMGGIRLFIISISFISVLITGIFISSQVGHTQMMNRDHMMNQNHMGMMQDMMGGRLPPGIAPEDLPDPDSVGAKLLVSYCTQCHNLPSPAMHTSGEWPEVAQRMFARLNMMSGMNEEWMGMMWMKAPTVEEQEIIVSYLQAHSLKPLGPGEIPSPESPAAATFKNACSQCHALPDPKLHTANEWPAVVARMQINMQTMGKQVITDDEKNEIAGYLTLHARQ